MRTRMLLMVVVVGLLAARVEAKDWETDFDKACERAKAENKCMLLDFTGSDWCGWCMKLEDEVFSKAPFKKFADESLVCVVLDFPQSKPQSGKLKKQNQALAQKFGVGGYPSVIVLNPAGEKIGQTGYQAGGPEKYVENLKTMVGKYTAASPVKPAAATDEAKPASKLQKLAAAPVTAAPAGVPADGNRAVRTWTARSGTTVDASLVKESGGVALLQRADGTRVQIAVNVLSSADQAYIESLKAPAPTAPADK